MSPDSRDVSLRYVGNSSSHREEIPNRRVWSQVLLPDVGLLNMLQEGFLVVEVTSSSGSSQLVNHVSMDQILRDHISFRTSRDYL